MGEPVPGQRRGDDVRQDITTSGSASSQVVGTGTQQNGSVNVSVNVQRGEDALPGQAAEPEPVAAVVRKQSIDNLAHRDRAFTGREAQLALVRERLTSGGAAVVQAVHGMGGVGKSQLVLEYAHRHLGEYDVVWWVSAEQTGPIGEQFTKLGVALGIIDAAADSTVAKAKVLEYLSGRDRWLLIFDNAVRREDVVPWLPRDTGHVLITSRSGTWHQVAQAVELDVLTPGEAVGFLTQQLSGLDADEAGRLAEALGELPLALAQAVGYLAKTGMPVPEYRRLLGDETQTVLELGQPVNYPQSLAAAITLSVGALGEAGPAAVAVLRLCALLAPEPIPVNLIDQVAHPVEPYPKVLDVLREVIGRPMARQQAIGLLGAYGLARHDAGTGTVTVHRLTQAVVRGQLEPSDAGELAVHLESALGGMNPGDPRDPANWPAWGRVLPHLLAVEPARSADPALRECARDAVVYLLSRGDTGPARQLVESLHEEWERRLGRDHRDTLRAATELVWALRDLGEYGRLRQVIDDTLTAQITALGYDDPDTLRSAADLAVVYNALGNPQRAEQIGRDVWERRQRVLGEEHPDTLMSASNVASSLTGLGRHQEALALKQRVWESRRRVLSEEHPSTLTSANNVASSLGELGRYQEALALERRVWESRRRVLGEEHPDTLLSASNVASSLTGLGRHQEALALMQRVWESRRRVLGEEHPSTLTSANNVASSLGDLGRHREALALKQRVWEQRQRVLGEEHPSTLTSAGSFASSLGDLGRHREALELKQRVWEQCQRVLGEEHPSTLTSANNVASSLGELGRHREALTLKQQVWERRQRVLGEEHPSTLLSSLNLAVTHLHLHQVLPARGLADRAWSGLRDKFGPQHPQTRQAADVRKAAIRMMGGRPGSGRRRG